MVGMPVKYYSYLLRMWRVPTDEDHTYRIFLDSVPTGEKCSFTNLEGLVVYLQRVLDSNPVFSDGDSQLSIRDE